MAQVSAQAMLQAIEEAYQKATKSKESALKFLKEAGIIQEDKTEIKAKSIKKKSK